MTDFQRIADRLLALVPEEREPEPAFDAGAWRRNMLEAGVPRRHLEPLTQVETGALSALAAFSEGILVLSGPAGCGKTRAAVGWLGRLVTDRGNAPPVARFMTAGKLERVGRYSGEEIGALEKIRYLVIDDLGNEYIDAKGYFISLLDGLINARYGDMRDTVITTNLKAPEFAESYGERIVDRIRECGRFVSLNEPSFRRPPPGAG